MGCGSRRMLHQGEMMLWLVGGLTYWGDGWRFLFPTAQMMSAGDKSQMREGKRKMF